MFMPEIFKYYTLYLCANKCNLMRNLGSEIIFSVRHLLCSLENYDYLSIQKYNFLSTHIWKPSMLFLTTYLFNELEHLMKSKTQHLELRSYCKFYKLSINIPVASYILYRHKI